MSLKIKKKRLPAAAISIHECFCLLYFLLYHMGCSGCKIKYEKKKLYYNKNYIIYRYIYRLIYLTGLIGASAYKIYDKEMNEAIFGHLQPVLKVVFTFECIICPVTYVEAILYFDWYHDKYVNLANTMQTLDTRMQKQFQNIEWNYQKSKLKYNHMTSGMYGLYSIAASVYIFSISHCACGWISSTIVAICYACVSGVPAIGGFLFIGNMDMLRLRFRLIQKLLRQHSSPARGKTRLMYIEKATKFKSLQNYFMEYSSLIVPLNQVFCVISGSSLFHSFVVITILGYLMCSKALDAKAKMREYVFISLFMIPRIYKVVNTAIYGYAAQKERQNCCQDFIKMGYYFKKSSLMQQQMEAFLHWHLHNNYRLTVGKILECNINLIFSTVNNIVNYVMILIQLQFQQNSIVNRFSNNTEWISKDNLH